MTSEELYNKIKPIKIYRYSAQMLSDGLSFNVSDIFCRFVKDAARCNGYNSDVYYDMKYIEKRLREFKEKEFEPIWVGFRKLGVDGTDYVLCRASDKQTYGTLASNYFALYSITIEKKDEGWYTVLLNEYDM